MNARGLSVSPNGRARRRRRAGLSLLEVTVATAIVGVLLVASLETLGAVVRSSRTNAASMAGELLARDLMAHILDASYEEPVDSTTNGTAGVWGPESDEQAGTREPFDDVDDFDGWDASPPVDAVGTPVILQNGWRRDVQIRYVQQAQPSLIATGDEGLKEIIVSVYFKGRLMTQLTALRADVD